jgi:hypothetical protein
MLKPHVQAIIKKGLSSESPEVRLQMLLNISDFLAAEEAKALSASAGKNKNKKKSAKPGTCGSRSGTHSALHVQMNSLFFFIS